MSWPSKYSVLPSSPESNCERSDPARHPAAHPLNPNLNGLHWSWAGGYVFLALEGHWREKGGDSRGYSFHLGNDPMLMTIELPLALPFANDQTIEISLHLDQMLNEATPFSDENASTHSRAGDALAIQLRRKSNDSLGRSASA